MIIKLIIRRASVFGLAITVSFVMARFARGQADPNATLARIKSVWLARQEKIRSGRVEWLEKHFEPKGSRFRGKPGVGDVPSQDEHYEIPGSLLFDKDRIRWAYTYPKGTISTKDTIDDIGVSGPFCWHIGRWTER
jgi:hypothetical protein